MLRRISKQLKPVESRTVKPASIASKTYAALHVDSAFSCMIVEQSTEIEELKKLVTQIQSQLSALTTSHYQVSKSTSVSNAKCPDKAKFQKGTAQSGKQSKA